jgi:hypothetical protein
MGEYHQPCRFLVTDKQSWKLRNVRKSSTSAVGHSWTRLTDSTRPDSCSCGQTQRSASWVQTNCLQSCRQFQAKTSRFKKGKIGGKILGPRLKRKAKPLIRLLEYGYVLTIRLNRRLTSRMTESFNHLILGMYWVSGWSWQLRKRHLGILTAVEGVEARLELMVIRVIGAYLECRQEQKRLTGNCRTRGVLEGHSCCFIMIKDNA